MCVLDPDEPATMGNPITHMARADGGLPIKRVLWDHAANLATARVLQTPYPEVLLVLACKIGSESGRCHLRCCQPLAAGRSVHGGCLFAPHCPFASSGLLLRPGQCSPPPLPVLSAHSLQ